MIEILSKLFGVMIGIFGSFLILMIFVGIADKKFKKRKKKKKKEKKKMTALDALKRKPAQIEKLSPSAYDKLQKDVDAYFDELWNKCQIHLQEVWIRMSCKILAEQLNICEDDLLIYIAGWTREYRNSAFHRKEYEQELKAAIAKIFPDGFPDKAIESLKTIGEDWRR